MKSVLASHVFPHVQLELSYFLDNILFISIFKIVMSTTLIFTSTIVIFKKCSFSPFLVVKKNILYSLLRSISIILETVSDSFGPLQERIV